MEILKWLQKWYQSNCDGSWEHMFGVKIDTLDNPGWSVHIDLADTNLEGKPFTTISRLIDDNNWLICKVNNDVFNGGGDSHKLEEILRVFKAWVEGNKYIE